MNKEQRLRQAALGHANMGDMEKHCELLVSVDAWTEALSVAPAVSHEYWRSLSERYASFLAEDSTSAAVPYLISSGNVGGLVDFYHSRGQLEEAFVVAKADQDGNFDAVKRRRALAGRGEGGSRSRGSGVASSAVTAGGGGDDAYDEDGADVEDGEDGEGGVSVKTGGGAGSADGTQSAARYSTLTPDLLERVSTLRARKYFNIGEPVLAACCLLAMGGSDAAIRILFRGYEPDLALALAVCLSAPGTVREPGVRPIAGGDYDYIRVALSKRCEFRGRPSVALDILRSCEKMDPTNHIRALAARQAQLWVGGVGRVRGGEEGAVQAPPFYKEAGLGTVEGYVERAAQCRERAREEGEEGMEVGGGGGEREGEGGGRRHHGGVVVHGAQYVSAVWTARRSGGGGRVARRGGEAVRAAAAGSDGGGGGS
jgi:hypothetical protein